MTNSNSNIGGSYGILLRFLVPALIGFVPLLTMALTWTPPHQHMSSATILMKGLGLPMLAAELLVIVLAMFSHEARKTEITAPRHIIWTLGTLIALAFATAIFLAPAADMAIARTLIYLVHLLFGVAIWRLSCSQVLKPEDMTAAMVTGFAAASIALIVFATGIPSSIQFNWTNNLPGYDNIRRVGYYSAPMIALCFGGLSTARSRATWVLYLIVAALGFGVVMWTGTRGAVYALGFLGLFAIMFFKQFRRPQVWGGALAAVAAGTGLSLILGDLTGFGGAERLIQTEEFSSGRVELWRETLTAIAWSPLVGHGEAQIAQLAPAFRGVAIFHPHNLLLQTLLAWGLIGTALIAILTVPAAMRTFRAVRDGATPHLPLFFAALVTMIYSGIDGTLFHTLSTGIFAACAGLLLSVRSASARPVAASGFSRELLISH